MSTKPEPPTLYSGKRLILVEDNDDTRFTLTTMLESFGCTVSGFAAGGDLLKVLPQTVADLFLLDIMLPGINGLELGRRIREEERFKNAPIIIVSARDESDDVIQGYQHGANYYLTKPFTKRQLEYGLGLFLARDRSPIA